MIDLAPTAGIPAAADPMTGELWFASGLAVEELAVRPLDAARDVYEDPPATAPPLYHMANGITAATAREPASALRYELTSLRPGLVGAEWVKTIGHIHDAASDGLGYPEAYEVVAGEATFVLFRPDPLVCLLVDAAVGERFAIPPGWHHLAVNRGQTAMVFADVVGRAVVPDYSLLRARVGAPVYLGPDGVRRNPRYPVCEPVRVQARELSLPTAHGPLWHAFTSRRDLLGYLLEPGGHRDAWVELDRLVT